MKKLVDVSLRVLVSLALVLGTVPTVALAEGVDEAEGAIVALADAVGTDSNYIVDWTECGTCLWSIDSEGALVVKPADGDEGYLDGTPWLNYKAKVRSARFEGTVKAPWDFSNAFQDMTRLEKIDLTGLDTSNTQYLDCLFDGCSKLASIDLSVLDTSNVTDMWFMFDGCSSLTSAKLSGLDTSMVSNVGGMFKGCSSLASFDVSCFEGPLFRTSSTCSTTVLH